MVVIELIKRARSPALHEDTACLFRCRRKKRASAIRKSDGIVDLQKVPLKPVCNFAFTNSLKRSVEVYERLNPSTLKRMEPPERFLSCDLRVLETTNQEGWRTTRRLVVSSSAAEKKPWLVESCQFALPALVVQ